MRIVATIECRMTSQRLPGKHLRPILGQPMLFRLVERLRRSRRLDAVVVATSTEASDAVLAELAERAGAAAYCGSLDDVMSRVIGAARSAEADVIVEITGDCPLVDPAIVDAVVGRYLAGGCDYVTNVLDDLTFPIGLDVQVFSRLLLERVERLTSERDDRLNVTSFIYRHPERYRLLNLRAPAALDRAGYRLCVDYPEDFALVTAIYESLYPHDPAFDARAIVRLLDGRPDLVRGNTNVPNAFDRPSSGGRARQEVLVELAEA